MNANSPDIRYYLVRLTTRLNFVETEASGQATVLLARRGPETDTESALVEEIVTGQYQNTTGRVVVSADAYKITQDAYNTQRIMLSAKKSKLDSGEPPVLG